MSAGLPAHEGFGALARHFARQIKPFLLRSGVIKEQEHAALCEQLETELSSQQFYGQSFLLRAWAPRL